MMWLKIYNNIQIQIYDIPKHANTNDFNNFYNCYPTLK